MSSESTTIQKILRAENIMKEMSLRKLRNHREMRKSLIRSVLVSNTLKTMNNHEFSRLKSSSNVVPVRRRISFQYSTTANGDATSSSQIQTLPTTPQILSRRPLSVNDLVASRRSQQENNSVSSQVNKITTSDLVSSRRISSDSETVKITPQKEVTIVSSPSGKKKVTPQKKRLARLLF